MYCECVLRVETCLHARFEQRAVCGVEFAVSVKEGGAKICGAEKNGILCAEPPPAAAERALVQTERVAGAEEREGERAVHFSCGVVRFGETGFFCKP